MVMAYHVHIIILRSCIYSIVYCLRVSASGVISAVFNDFAGLVIVAEASGETIAMAVLLRCTASSGYSGS